MTFRDDHDAALARAQALQTELERSEAERKRLEAEVAALKAPRPPRAKRPTKRRPRKSAPPPDARPGMSSATKVRLLWGAAGGLAIVIAFVVASMNDCSGQKAHEAWQARVRARDAHQERWRALASVEPCVRRVVDTQARRVALDLSHPEQIDGYAISQLVANCTDGARRLAGDPRLARPARDALAGWLDAEQALMAPVNQARAYFGEADWKEDGGAGGRARWDAVKAALATRLRAVVAVRATTLPALRDEIRRLQAEQAAARGKDEVWWRVELELALWGIDDAAWEAMGRFDGVPARPLDEDTAAAPAVQAQVTALLAAAKQAPIEVRRDLRDVDWITGPLADGVAPRGETPLWHLSMFGLLDGTWERPPAMPPDPGPEPDYHPD
ncbi:MAG TPA: hypothetical protein VMZ28_21445 [Kofleriaceae bacterium]|nr:hypothetical protein [Kofleriaceae bacterium]